jgi:glutamine synthetase
MGGSTARLQAIDAVKAYEPPASSFALHETPGEIFGENVFSKSVMQKRLPKAVFKSVMATIDHSHTLDPAVADAVAVAMKDWALEKGATHYAHVFYPLTGLTAEKHDSFFEPNGDGSSLAEFAGKTLPRGSPTRRASRTVVCARRSKPAATPDGTSRVPRISSRTRTATHCVFRRCSCR